MSALKINSLQIGQSLSATNNFTWYQPISPDGTIRLGNGNSGSVTDLVTLTSAGNLGIGTSSPGFKLDISCPAGATPIQFQSGTGGVWQIGPNAGSGTSDDTFSIYSGTYGPSHGYNPLLILNSSGNIGLGVTPSAWSGYTSLEMAFPSFGIATNKSSGAVYVVQNSYQNSPGNWVYKYAEPASQFITSESSFVWKLATSGTAGAAINFTQAMTLDASGALQLGTTQASGSKQAIKTSAGNTTIGSSLGLLISGKTASSVVGERLEIGFRSWEAYNSYTGSMVGMGAITTSTTGNELADLYFYTTNTASSLTPVERARIDSSGRMTIPYQPSFKAQLTTNTNYSVGVAKHTPFTTVHWNTGNCYSTSTGRFTAPVAGYYLFEGNESTGSNATASGYLSFEFYINGTRRITGWNSKPAGYQKEYSTAVFYLNANDYVECGIETQQAITFIGSSSTTSTYTYFSGRLLG